MKLNQQDVASNPELLEMIRQTKVVGGSERGKGEQVLKHLSVFL